VREVLAGIHRTKGVAPKKKRAIENDLLAMLVATITGEGLRPARDRALLLLGWTLGCRRSELAQLDIEHVAWVDQGLRVLIARGKTDQEGAGRHVGIPHAAEPKLCPVRQLRAYLDLLGAEQGPLFRRVTATGAPGERLSPKSIADVVKRAAGAAGFPADDFGGHSLRAGFITAAYRDGKSLAAIMQHTGHRSERVALGYVRLATLFDDNPADGLL
jgi:integrase